VAAGAWQIASHQARMVACRPECANRRPAATGQSAVDLKNFVCIRAHSWFNSRNV
jgi:hypothetical protein